MAQVRLDPKIDSYIDTLIENGEASTKEDYVNQVLKERYEDDQRAAAEFWSEVEEGRAEIEAGRYTSVEEAFDIVRRELGLVKPAVK